MNTPANYVLWNQEPGQPPRLWNLYATEEAAAAARSAPLTQDHTTDLSAYTVTTYADFVAKERAFWLDGKISEIDQAGWDYALNVLPPMKWHTADGVELFLMSEFTSGVFTSQYAKRKGRFFTATVDAYDKSTWLTAEKLDAHLVADTVTVEVDDENDALQGFSVMWRGETFADQVSKADAERLAKGMTTKPLTLKQLHNVLFYQMGWEPVDVGAFMLTCEKLDLVQPQE